MYIGGVPIPLQTQVVFEGFNQTGTYRVARFSDGTQDISGKLSEQQLTLSMVAYPGRCPPGEANATILNPDGSVYAADFCSSFPGKIIVDYFLIFIP